MKKHIEGFALKSEVDAIVDRLVLLLGLVLMTVSLAMAVSDRSDSTASAGSDRAPVVRDLLPS